MSVKLHPDAGTNSSCRLARLVTLPFTNVFSEFVWSVFYNFTAEIIFVFCKRCKCRRRCCSSTGLRGSSNRWHLEFIVGVEWKNWRMQWISCAWRTRSKQPPFHRSDFFSWEVAKKRENSCGICDLAYFCHCLPGNFSKCNFAYAFCVDIYGSDVLQSEGNFFRLWMVTCNTCYCYGWYGMKFAVDFPNLCDWFLTSACL